jgi:hypothetical protein
VLIRGRLDESDKGRVVLAEEVRALAEVLREPTRRSDGEGMLHACRLRIPADAAGAALTALGRLCAEHAGAVPLFVHVLLADQEVVLRSRAFHVSAAPPFVAAVEAVLGHCAVTVDHAGSA